MASTTIPCRWDWCRSSFPSLDALDAHVKHEHIWPMKPMRKAEIALMRRMDLQSLHSSPHTESSIVSRGPTAAVPRSKATPPPVSPTSIHQHPENDPFDTFAQLSSPPQTHSPQKLPASPAFEGLVRQGGHSGLSAAVEMFERAHGHKTNQRLRPLSSSSGSSQEVVEQQLTQEDEVVSQSLLAFPELPAESEPVDTELRWPTDDESDAPASEDISNPEQPVSNPPGSSPHSTRGQNFRCGSLSIPLGINNYSASPPTSSELPRDPEGSRSQSQPFVLQTQAPYSSQATGWSDASATG